MEVNISLGKEKVLIVFIHYAGLCRGLDYCGSCADEQLPCSKGKENAVGERCPHCESEPQTMEGIRCDTQIRFAANAF